MNKVILKGRTTKIPELKYAENSEQPMCHAGFTPAVEDRGWKEADDKYHVDFIRCYAIGKIAELLGRTVGKGQELAIVGKWRTSGYEKDGRKIHTNTLFVQELYYCGRKADSPAPYDDSFMNIPDEFDSELPFN